MNRVSNRYEKHRKIVKLVYFLHSHAWYNDKGDWIWDTIYAGGDQNRDGWQFPTSGTGDGMFALLQVVTTRWQALGHLGSLN